MGPFLEYSILLPIRTPTFLISGLSDIAFSSIASSKASEEYLHRGGRPNPEPKQPRMVALNHRENSLLLASCINPSSYNRFFHDNALDILYIGLPLFWKWCNSCLRAARIDDQHMCTCCACPDPALFPSWYWLGLNDGSQAIVSVGCIGGRRLLHSRQFLHSRTKRCIIQYLELPVQVVWRAMVRTQCPRAGSTSKWVGLGLRVIMDTYVLPVLVPVWGCAYSVWRILWCMIGNR